jgi:O-methyltransferase
MAGLTIAGWGTRIARRIARDVRGAARRIVEQRYLNSTLHRVRPYTMVPEGRLIQLARDVDSVLAERIPGAFVECGVWRGGASFLMADLLRRKGLADRTVWMFDSFEGLPPPSSVDGTRAQHFKDATDDPAHWDNCTASLEEVRDAAQHLGLTSRVELVKGWFDQTLPAKKADIGPIALLRIDGDWYESVKTCLEELYEQVSPGGYVIVDDYYDWPGCAIAVHEYLGTRKYAHRMWTQYTGATVAIRKLPDRER